MFNNILLAIGLGLLLASLALAILLLNDRRVRRSHLIAERHRALGLPEGELVYEDADGLGEPLSSSGYPLVGKPDYVVKLAVGRPVPIELKLILHVVIAPHSNHMINLAAYCFILKVYFLKAPTHAILRFF